jgi:hypothetical protein
MKPIGINIGNNQNKKKLKKEIDLINKYSIDPSKQSNNSISKLSTQINSKLLNLTTKINKSLFNKSSKNKNKEKNSSYAGPGSGSININIPNKENKQNPTVLKSNYISGALFQDILYNKNKKNIHENLNKNENENENLYRNENLKKYFDENLNQNQNENQKIFSKKKDFSNYFEKDKEKEWRESEIKEKENYLKISKKYYYNNNNNKNLSNIKQNYEKYNKLNFNINNFEKNLYNKKEIKRKKAYSNNKTINKYIKAFNNVYENDNHNDNDLFKDLNDSFNRKIFKNLRATTKRNQSYNNLDFKSFDKQNDNIYYIGIFLYK